MAKTPRGGRPPRPGPDPPAEGTLAVGLEDLRGFVEIAEQRSIQSAARRRGRSRATYVRLLARLERVFEVDTLLERAPGQRHGLLTPAGAELLRRSRSLLRTWDEWRVTTRDALANRRGTLRIGALPGSFDLIAEALTDLRASHPALVLRVAEYDDEHLVLAIRDGEVDLGFGTLDRVPPGLAAIELGALSWAVILPRAAASGFGTAIRLRELGGVPLVTLRSGPVREHIERSFAEHEGGPLVFDAAFEVGATPRIVELVARGFGPAIVSRFRLAFLPCEVVVRPLVDGPAPVLAAVLHRRGAPLGAEAQRLLASAQRRFAELSAPLAAPRGTGVPTPSRTSPKTKPPRP